MSRRDTATGTWCAATGLVAAAVLLVSPVADALSLSNLPPARVKTLSPRVVSLRARVVTLTPRIISEAPQRVSGNTFRVGTDVLFAFDSAALSPDAQTVLSGLIARLRQERAGTATIVGYTDSIGTVTYNLGLSRRRAASVVAFLQARVGNPRLTYRSRGLGEADPVAPNTTPDGRDNPPGRQRNRRVEISFAAS